MRSCAPLYWQDRGSNCIASVKKHHLSQHEQGTTQTLGFENESKSVEKKKTYLTSLDGILSNVAHT